MSRASDRYIHEVFTASALQLHSVESTIMRDKYAVHTHNAQTHACHIYTYVQMHLYIKLARRVSSAGRG